MTDQAQQLPWTRPGWWEAATGWVQEQLDGHGLRLAGSIEPPHVRPWSMVLRVPTREGLLFFKATAPVLVHGPGLTAALAHWRTDCMSDVLAADSAGG